MKKLAILLLVLMVVLVGAEIQAQTLPTPENPIVPVFIFNREVVPLQRSDSLLNYWKGMVTYKYEEGEGDSVAEGFSLSVLSNMSSGSVRNPIKISADSAQPWVIKGRYRDPKWMKGNDIRRDDFSFSVRRDAWKMRGQEGKYVTLFLTRDRKVVLAPQTVTGPDSLRAPDLGKVIIPPYFGKVEIIVMGEPRLTIEGKVEPKDR
mgnify:CR=1 FL=1